jgi:hypothetical protein
MDMVAEVLRTESEIILKCLDYLVVYTRQFLRTRTEDMATTCLSPRTPTDTRPTCTARGIVSLDFKSLKAGRLVNEHFVTALVPDDISVIYGRIDSIQARLCVSTLCHTPPHQLLGTRSQVQVSCTGI